MLNRVCATVAVVLLCACDRGERDYLTPDLRERVEALKADAAREETSRDNAFERAATLWDWGNAYALNDGIVPVNLTIDLTLARLAEVAGTSDFMPPGIDWGWEKRLELVDRYIEELALKDEEPEALGQLEAVTSDPLVSRDWATVELRYTVGSRGLEPGAAFLFGRQLMADYGQLQLGDPTADNHVTIEASREGASFEAYGVPLAGMHGGFFSYRDMPAARLVGRRLEPDDVVTLRFGDRSGGSRGFRVQTLASDAMLLPVYVDLDGSGTFLTPAWPPLEVEGGREVERVTAFAPSLVAVGEPFELAVRFEDAWSNRSTGSIPAFEVRAGGEPLRQVEAGGPPLQLLSGLSFDVPGTYRFEVATSADGSPRGTSNPVWVQAQPTSRVYWGETHGHTAFAEGQGSPESYFRYGEEDARLDFLTLSEHDVWLDDFEWRTLQELTRRYTEKGRLIAFLGYEWSAFRARGGHHNVFFRTADEERIGFRDAPDLPLLHAALKERHASEEVLVIPHAHRAGDWTTSDADLEKLVEIYSLHGSFEWFGNRYLQNGFEIGFIAASDDHRSKPGYAIGSPSGALSQHGGLAAVLAAEKTPEAIFAALRSLSAYATSGERILLDVTLNGQAMGTRQGSSQRRELQARVSGTLPIDRIDVIKNGEIAFSRSYLTRPLAPRCDLLVTFESSSEVFANVVDNPRPYRFWRGALDVESARLLAVDAVGFDNRFVDRAEIDPEQPNRIRFTSATRGRGDTLLLQLEGVTSATTLHFQLESTREQGFAQGLRAARTLPAADLRLRLGDLRSGRLEHRFEVGQHTDRIHLQVVDPGGRRDQELQFVDLEEVADGDYYYLRVTQIDGSRAWSSPFWVGRREDS